MTSEPSDAMTAFLQLHHGLTREGPGEPADVHWAAVIAGLSDSASVADVGCGTGGDIAALLEVARNGQITALDTTAQFVADARATWGHEPRVTILHADMARIANSYDLIWCAGAIYFLGITDALRRWRKSLRPGGVVAFSEACWLTDTPSEAAQEFWAAEYPDMTSAAGIADRVEAAGYDILGTRILSDAAWEAYYRPLDARIASLRATADDELTRVLDAAEVEAACWRAHRDEYGYQLTVVRPK